VIQRRKSAVLGDATRTVIETLESRQLLSATLTTSSSLMVFNAVNNSSPSQTETLTLTNTGDATLTLGGGAIELLNDPNSGSQEAARFGEVNAGSIPNTLAPGQSFGLQLNYSALAVETDTAVLDLITNDPANPVQVVQLHGIGTRGLGGSNQPSLATILQAYNIPTLVGLGPNDANALTDTTYPEPPDPSSQEVPMQRMVKAGAGPVTISVLASFTASGTKPYTLGMYTPGNPADRTELFFTPSSEAQSTYVQPQGTTSFDPGANQFGFYYISNVQVKGRIGYSEDELNPWDTTDPRKFRFFPMENPDGSVVPNTFIMTTTEWNAPIGYDFTNIVAVIHNVKAAVDEPVAGLQDLNALPNSTNMIFNRIQSPNSVLGDIVHDTGTLQVNNTGDAPLIISSYTLSSGWKLVSPPSFPVTVAPESHLDLKIQFVATSEPAHPYNETNGPSYGGGGGMYSGAITLNSNDPINPVVSYQLRGWWQLHSENENEPGLQTIANLMLGYQTNIATQQLTNLTEAAPSSTAVPTYYGEETVSGYWQAADTGQNVTVTQVDSFHTEGEVVTTYWFAKGGGSNKLYSTVADTGQSFLPYAAGTTTPATGGFTTSSTFGFRIDGEYSDDAKNSYKSGGGHHIRFYPVRDANSNIIPNEYLMALDYSNIPENFDFQDEVYIVTNIKPAIVTKGISAPQTTGAPATPTDLGILSSNDINTLTWAPVADSTLQGYNVYRSTSVHGPYTLIISSPIAALTFADTTAPFTGISYYKVTAVDTNTTESIGVMDSVANTGGTPGTPVAAPESATTPFQTAVTIGVAADATDATGTLIPGSVAISTPAGHGLTSIDPNTGAITYTPSTGFSGVDSFQYTISDTTGAVSAPATITIAVNQLVVGNPVAANLSFTAIQAVPLLIDDVSKASDTTGTIDPTTVAITHAPSHGTATVNPSTGEITYTATAGYAGPDSIMYTIGDNLLANSAAATITLNVVSSGPVAASFSTIAAANTANSINVISSGSDPTGNILPADVVITTAPLHGTATVDPSTGVIIYTPAIGYLGTDSLIYTLGDGSNNVSKPATLSLSVGVGINNTNARSLAFTDTAGNKVTITLTGGASGVVFFNGSGSAQSISGPHGTGSVTVTGTGLSINNISVTGSTLSGALTISRKGSSSVSLGGLTVSNPIGKIIAPTTTLTGTLAVTGAVTLLQLGSATGATITIGSASATKAGLTVQSTGQFTDTTLTSDTPIKSIKVLGWTGTGSAISAPAISSLVTTANLEAAVTTTGATPFSIGTVRVGAQLGTEAWNITGPVNSIVAGSVATGWTGNFSGAVNSLNIRAGGFAGSLTAGSVNNLSITGDDTGTISAGSIKTMRVAGMINAANLTLTNAVQPKIMDLGRLSVTGVTFNSKITSAGNIGTITTTGISGSAVDAGVAAGVTLATASSNFTASATIASFSVVGRGSEFTNTMIGAEFLGSLHLGQIITDNQSTPFGVAALTINSLSATLDTGGVMNLNKTTLASTSTISAYLSAHSLNVGNFQVTPGV